MTLMVRGLATCAVLLGLGLGLAGCGDDPPVGTSVGSEMALAASPLTLAREVTFARVGDGFVLATADGAEMRWAKLSSKGELSPPSSFTLPVLPATMPDGNKLGPYLAVTGKAAAADQLVAVIGVAKAGATDEYEILAFTGTAGATAAAVQTTLGTLVSGQTSGTVRILAGSSPTGMRALVAWGVEGQQAPVSYVVVGGDGAPQGAGGKLYPSAPAWRCLRMSDGLKSIGVVGLEPTPGDTGHPTWRIVEIDDEGKRAGEYAVILTSDVEDCRIISAPAREGYNVAWQNQSGTFFAQYFALKQNQQVNSRIVLAAADFGGYVRMPRVAWVASAGADITIGLERNQGPEVVRFDAFANPRGRSLHLPSKHGQTGPVAAWVGPDATYVTYLDQAPADKSAPSERLLVTVTASADLR
jgi:hypothetical protein